MTKLTTIIACFALGTGSWSGIAHAGPGSGLEIGGITGAHVFADDLELGVPDTANPDTPRSSALMGFRLGYQINRRVGVEGELVLVPTVDRAMGDTTYVIGYRAQGLFNLKKTGRLRPFLVVGLGGMELATTRDDGEMRDDTDLAFHWGGGVTFALSHRLLLRFDARNLILPSNTDSGATDNYELMAGLTIGFGKKTTRTDAPTPLVQRRVKKPGDRDRDGLVDSIDDCPTEREDADGYEDEDGCPDLDNDADGIADVDDKCPDRAETANGYEDSDGCPDEIIVELGGIEFQRGSARIDAGSEAILDRAVEVMREHPQLAVEIAGHTSSEGEYEDNVDLSKDRAEAVKAYLVDQGVEAERIRTVGYGPDEPIADNETLEGRARNRRIEFRILPAGTRARSSGEQ